MSNETVLEKRDSKAVEVVVMVEAKVVVVAETVVVAQTEES